MDLAQVIEGLRRSLAAKRAQREAITASLTTILDGATARGAVDLNEDEQTRYDAGLTERAAVDVEIDGLKARLERFEAAMAEEVRVGEEDLVRRAAATPPAYDQVARVGQEQRTYTKRSAKSEGLSFFSDAYNAQRGNLAARDRIERHGREVIAEREITERALATGGVAGLVVPQYLVELAAPLLRSGRPLANIVNRHELPEKGMSLIIPRGTTGASAAEQATENSPVSNTDEVWANLTVPVCTVSGQQDVSRQALERGETIDTLVYSDLARAHAAKVDNLIINGSGASGQPLGILNTGSIGAATAFGAAASAVNFNLKVAGQIAAVASAGGALMARVLVMHPRRWGWLTGLVDGANRPIVVANSSVAQNALAVISKPGSDSDDAGDLGALFVGTHSSGLPVLSDLNIPTNVGTNSEDVVLALDTAEHHLWEDGDGLPRQLEFEQTTGGSLTTKLVVYSYIAFTAGRYPGATGKVGGVDATGGNGLIAPTF